MKNTSVIVLAILLAASLITGLVLYRHDRIELQNKDEQIADLQRQLEASTAAVASLEAAAANNQKNIDSLRSQLTALQGEKQATTTEAGELRTRHQDEVLALNHKIQLRDEKIAELENRLTAAGAEITDLGDAIKKSHSEIERLRDQSSALQSEKETAAAEAEARVAKHRDEMAAFEQKLRVRDEVIADLDKQLKANVSELASLADELTKSRGDVERLQRRDKAIADLETQLKANGTEIAELNDSLAKSKNDVERLQGRASSLQEEKDAALAAVKALEAQLKDALTTGGQALQRRDETIAELTKRLGESDARIASLTQTADQRKGEVTELNRKIARSSDQEAALKSQLDQLKSSYDSMVSGLKNQIQTNEITIENLKDKLSITFVDQILFDSGKATVTPRGKQILAKVGESLKMVAGKRIQVIGHTDDRGILPEYRYRFPSNWELSALRAAAVVRALEDDLGMDVANVEVVGRSFHDPIAGNDTELGRSRNRRVNIIIAPKVD